MATPASFRGPLLREIGMGGGGMVHAHMCRVTLQVGWHLPDPPLSYEGFRPASQLPGASLLASRDRSSDGDTE